MGTPRGGNGDEQPPGGGGPFDGVSGLPPEWGPVIIPDDVSALSDESDAIRKQFRRDARRYRWRRRLRLTVPRNRESASLAVPLAIIRPPMSGHDDGTCTNDGRATMCPLSSSVPRSSMSIAADAYRFTGSTARQRLSTRLMPFGNSERGSKFRSASTGPLSSTSAVSSAFHLRPASIS